MKVESGHLDDVEWSDGTLTITFKDGATYAYYDVPNGLFQEFLGSASKSTFFREHIKGAYEYERI